MNLPRPPADSAFTTYTAPSDYRGCHGEYGDSCHPFSDDDPNHTSLTCYLRSCDPEPPYDDQTFDQWADFTRSFWDGGTAPRF